MTILTVDEFVASIGDQEADSIAGTGLRQSRTLDVDKITAALAFAENLIMGYVRARYPAPIDPVPDILKGLCVDIAWYRLRLKTGDQSGVTPEVKARYDDALRQLRDIQAGRLAIDANQPGANNAPAEERPVLTSGRPSRAGGVLSGYHLDDGASFRRRGW